MKKLFLLASIVAITVVLTSCGGMTSGDFYVKYTDDKGTDVNFGTASLGYSYSMGLYMNTFGGTPQKVVQFMMKDSTDIAAEGMAGKEINIMIWESNETIVWNPAEFDPAKTFTGTIESVEYFKEGMMGDKTYKVKGKFNADKFKNGEFCLQVNI